MTCSIGVEVDRQPDLEQAVPAEGPVELVQVDLGEVRRPGQRGQLLLEPLPGFVAAPPRVSCVTVRVSASGLNGW